MIITSILFKTFTIRLMYTALAIQTESQFGLIQKKNKIMSTVVYNIAEGVAVELKLFT